MGPREWAGALRRSVLANFGIGVQMDGNARSANMNVDRSNTKPLDGYTFYLLSLDGTIATVRKTRADDAFELTVEVRDRKALRKLSADVAQNPRSAEFERAVREVKAELFRRRQGGNRPG